jgi:hypothetical protein
MKQVCEFVKVIKLFVACRWRTMKYLILIIKIINVNEMYLSITPNLKRNISACFILCVCFGCLIIIDFSG